MKEHNFKEGQRQRSRILAQFLYIKQYQLHESVGSFLKGQISCFPIIGRITWWLKAWPLELDYLSSNLISPFIRYVTLASNLPSQFLHP